VERAAERDRAHQSASPRGYRDSMRSHASTPDSACHTLRQ
jgi:hypothetical protein